MPSPQNVPAPAKPAPATRATMVLEDTPPSGDDLPNRLPPPAPAPGPQPTAVSGGGGMVPGKKDPKPRKLTLGNIAAVAGTLASLAAVIGVLIALNVISPFPHPHPRVAPSATPNLQAFSDPSLGCRTDHTIDPKAPWRSDGHPTATKYYCIDDQAGNAFGLAISNEELFAKIAPPRFSSQSWANYLGETRQVL